MAQERQCLPGGDAFIKTDSTKEARVMDIWLMWTEATESTNTSADDDSANTSNMSQTPCKRTACWGHQRGALATAA